MLSKVVLTEKHDINSTNHKAIKFKNESVYNIIGRKMNILDITHPKQYTGT